MDDKHLRHRFTGAVAIVALSLLIQTPSGAEEAAGSGSAMCLGCHGNATTLAGSAHGKTHRCIDCHAAQAVVPHAQVPNRDAARLAMNQTCSACHRAQAASYAITSHGKIATLGYAQTATCADCHGSHDILPASATGSRVAAARLLDTCRECHRGATQGFASYQAHATTSDFARYPQMWLAAWSMVGLLALAFGLLWTHSVLWLYREWRDRRERKLRPHVSAGAISAEDRRQYARWSPAWRAAHLVFTVCVIVLVASAIPLLYPGSAWAPWLVGLFGGPAAASAVHKWAAVIMLAVFLGHLVYVAAYLARNWRTFEWFGPYSLMPNWQDVRDFVAMWKWFVGQGPRPVCDHWNYMQKIDYWAPFWGIAMLSWTGAMLWFKELNAAYLPGWTLNVATLVHGEEALLAAVYLFTIHFFANHWRPDKFPLDLVMFTGSMPIEEFRREYTVEYQRLAETGELEKYLVNEPARPMTLASQILGFALVAVGLLLLAMMANGFAGKLAG